MGREGGHFELCEVCHPSGGAEWAIEPNNLEIWKRSRLQRDTGCCRHTGTLSIKTVNEERVEKEDQKGTLQVPWPLRHWTEKRESAKYTETSRKVAGGKPELDAIRTSTPNSEGFRKLLTHHIQFLLKKENHILALDKKERGREAGREEAPINENGGRNERQSCHTVVFRHKSFRWGNKDF